MTKEQILATRNAKVIPVHVPDWGDTHLRIMSGSELDAYEQVIYSGGGAEKKRVENVRAELLVRCLSDEAGKRIFSDTDAGELGQVHGWVLDFLFDKARTMNRMTRESQEELEKNSAGEVTAASGSPSQVT